MQKWFISAFLLFLPVWQLKSQNVLPDRDLELLKTQVQVNYVNQHAYHVHSRPFPFKGSKNPAKLALGSMMWFYQNVISPQLSASCLYEPTCSSYSIKLLEDYGILRGMVLTTDRLSRCNRLALMDIPEYRVNLKTGRIPESTSYYKWPAKNTH